MSHSPNLDRLAAERAQEIIGRSEKDGAVER